MKKMRTALAVALLLLFLGPIASAQNKQGAEVVVILKSGIGTEGELVAVKRDFLVLSWQNYGGARDESVGVVDIREVKVIRPSKTRPGAIVGGLVGVILGVALAAPQNREGLEGIGPALAALGIGVAGMGIGAFVGTKLGEAKSFILENRPEPDLDSILIRLSRFARIPGIQ